MTNSFGDLKPFVYKKPLCRFCIRPRPPTHPPTHAQLLATLKLENTSGIHVPKKKFETISASKKFCHFASTHAHPPTHAQLLATLKLENTSGIHVPKKFETISPSKKFRHFASTPTPTRPPTPNYSQLYS